MLLVFVGPKWLEILTERQGSADDYVRLEIEAALKLRRPMILLRVDEADIPQRAALPSEIREFAETNAIPIRAGYDFETDYHRLVDLIAERGVRIVVHGPENARLEQIAGLVASILELDAIRAPSNYGKPLRALLNGKIRNETGITEKSDDAVIIGKVGWQLMMFELQAGFEQAFGVELEFSLDSSVRSIYSEIFDD